MDNFNLKNVWGDPQEYKGIKIYPVKIKDMLDFYNNVNCLLVNKNKFKDKELIKISYLLFIYVISQGQPEFLEMLFNLLKVILKEQEFYLDFSDEKLNLIINETIIDEYEFDNLKNIILNQNLVSVSQMLDEELENRLKEANDFLASKNKAATLEERIIAYHCVSGMKYEDIKELTIYQFNKGLERMQLIKNFEVYTYPMLKGGSGDKIQDWLSHIEDRGLYDHLLIDESKFQQITNSIN